MLLFSVDAKRLLFFPQKLQTSRVGYGPWAKPKRIWAHFDVTKNVLLYTAARRSAEARYSMMGQGSPTVGGSGPSGTVLHLRDRTNRSAFAIKTLCAL